MNRVVNNEIRTACWERQPLRGAATRDCQRTTYADDLACFRLAVLDYHPSFFAAQIHCYPNTQDVFNSIPVSMASRAAVGVSPFPYAAVAIHAVVAFARQLETICKLAHEASLSGINISLQANDGSLRIGSDYAGNFTVMPIAQARGTHNYCFAVKDRQTHLREHRTARQAIRNAIGPAIAFKLEQITPASLLTATRICTQDTHEFSHQCPAPYCCRAQL